MSELSPSIVADVVAACKAAAAEMAGALGRALDGEFTLGEPQQGRFSPEETSEGWAGPGLVVLLTLGQTGLAIVLPESSGLLPSWDAAPDATADSKLSTLAQELSMLLLPKTLAVDKFEARRVPSLRAALDSGGTTADASLVAVEVTRGNQSSALQLIWPLATPARLFAGTSASAASATRSDPAGKMTGAAATNDSLSGRKDKTADFSRLPNYSRSLLKIRIPVSIHLASKKELVQEVVGLVPGTIIKFEKGCDESLQMMIGGQAVVEGEAVKIGDKFGFRVTGMLLPQEHFVPVRRQRTA